ncbi:MAG: carbamoyl transferase [Planctomycetes bacterium]|nr:carbamoyl transferase [Planctomycetota bacterium]
MNILGISGGVKIGNQEGAAALLVDGKLVAAAEEERFVGIKFANGLLPKHATKFCLQQAGIGIKDLDAVVFAGATYDDFEEILRRFFGLNFGHAPPIRLVDHHRAHAASTFYGSGWEHALVVTIDRSGDRKSTTVSIGQNGRLKTLEEIYKPNSLGIFYSAVTQFLGFQTDSDEYKVMGMAGYGTPCHDFSKILEVTDTGYHFHHEFITGISADKPGPSKQERLFDSFPLPFSPRIPGSPISQDHFDIAASAQHQLEQAVLRLIGSYVASTGVGRVCLAGGVTLNSLMNQKIRQMDCIEQLYIPPICSDAGLALGAAYLHCVEHGTIPDPLKHAYWGPEFTSAEIRTVLDRTGVSYTEISDPVEAAVERISQGRIIGWFQGRMEYGPRALGNRSILANPQEPTMKDVINAKVKFREEFRPLAPSVLHEAGAEYFENYADSPFMTETFPAKEVIATRAPAVVHVDGTSRLQSVHRETNPLYAELISAVEKQTGIPVVLNTSFNAYNDPIACEPYQALRTLFATGLDSLVIGDFVLDK